ncbi:hypothetical protein CD120_00185 [Staphylococcus saprophyticus]|uniref:hypothetical protein n=1 Tax=Staphylococcus saprophyticus TaxID=29385 RepID=UPI000CD180D2|nr:hypothetical protein [Staphylococcus saprophyticus]MDW3797372.1 hypothetical protein [Staphylococcus saprophyticus]PNZ75415.1 hypothetical protein CD120_00185 [Staphylococcus saprophyticus]
MNKITCLLIGQDPFNSDKYENMKYKHINKTICFNDIAFIPVPKKSNGFKIKYNSITSYTRMLGLINKTKINENNFVHHHSNVVSKIKNLAKNGVYLVNFTELKNINFFESKLFNDDITLICFGDTAIEGVNNLNLRNTILQFPHPSNQNKHPLWYEFYDTPRIYNGVIEITSKF